MSETVRLVSDGEELVLWADDLFRVHSKADPRDPAVQRKGESAASKRIAIRYVGFHDNKGRREYVLQARRGDEARGYVLWIELTAFARRQALLQDGPDICYQKLLHELAGSELQGSDNIAVTDGDLAAYRETHTRPARRGFSPSRAPEPSKARTDDPQRKGGHVS
jgi:hypothetical protein